jgi:putative SOS response-associated peptidase YedK
MKSPCVRIEPTDEAQLKSLLVPYPSDGMIACPVSARVGGVKNNDPSLIEPIHLPGASGDRVIFRHA